MLRDKKQGKEIARFMMVKERHRRTMLRAIADGKADRQVIPLLKFIASSRDFFTSSSCSGRILLLKLDSKGSKAESAFIERWHRQVNFTEFLKAVRNARGNEIWFKLDPFILHVGTDSLENARRILKTMQVAGVKRGGIINAKDGKFIVEMIGTQTISLPIKLRGKMLAENGYLKWLLAKANKKLSANYVRLGKLKKAFEAELG
ncbi:MAG: hypothetical protein WC602_06695 [archaeon]